MKLKPYIAVCLTLLLASMLAPFTSQARYLNPATGRFWTMDSFEGNQDDPPSLHKYLYCQADPANRIDPTGQWPTKVKPVHQNSIRRALWFSSRSDLDTLAGQADVMDTMQQSSLAYLHSMTAPGQTPVEAWRKANRFVYSELSLARHLQSKADRTGAMVHLGNAIHTIQDGTCDAHFFKVWDDRWKVDDDPVVDHVAAEFYDPGPGSQLDIATHLAWEYFSRSEALPTRFIAEPTDWRMKRKKIESLTHPMRQVFQTPLIFGPYF